MDKFHKIDDKFLNEKIKPRIIIFMADGTNLNSLKKAKQDVSLFEKQGPNNVAINLNKYIAKYDFEIASKLKHEEKETLSKD